LKLAKKQISLSEIEMETFEAVPDSTTDVTKLPVVLCLHGFPDNMHSFDNQLIPFTDAGYRVLVPAMPGYTPASIVNPLPSLWEMGLQMREFIEKMEINDIHLIGHDWGAYFTSMLLKSIPGRFRDAVTMGFPPPDTILRLGSSEPPMNGAIRHWYTVMFNFHGYGDCAFELNGYELVEVLWRHWSPNWKFTPEELGAVQDTYAQSGVSDAALQYYRSQATPPKEGEPSIPDIFGNLIEVPFLSIGGVEDNCTEVAAFSRVYAANYLKGYELKMIQAGHFPHREKPEEVNQIILDYWKRNALA